jgi:hypothetical protein
MVKYEFFLLHRKKGAVFSYISENETQKTLQGSAAWHIIIRVLQKN